MKRVKKNQVIITALAIMIAVAGYINYAGNISDIISVSSKSGSKVVNTSTDDTIFTEEEPDDESLEGVQQNVTVHQGLKGGIYLTPVQQGYGRLLHHFAKNLYLTL